MSRYDLHILLPIRIYLFAASIVNIVRYRTGIIMTSSIKDLLYSIQKSAYCNYSDALGITTQSLKVINIKYILYLTINIGIKLIIIFKRIKY